MKSLHLLLAGVLSTSAYAEVPRPEASAPKSDEKADRVSLAPRKAAPPKARPTSDDGWVELATPTLAKHGTEFISVDPKAGAVATLRVEATQGNVVFDHVVVTFADDTTKVIRQRRWLTPQKPSMLVELGAAKPIKKLIVTTDRAPAGIYAIFGAGPAPVATR